MCASDRKQDAQSTSRENPSPWPQGRREVPQVILKKGAGISTAEKLAKKGN